MRKVVYSRRKLYKEKIEILEVARRCTIREDKKQSSQTDLDTASQNRSLVAGVEVVRLRGSEHKIFDSNRYALGHRDHASTTFDICSILKRAC